MTLNFDAIAGGNHDWGFDSFSGFHDLSATLVSVNSIPGTMSQDATEAMGQSSPLLHQKGLKTHYLTSHHATISHFSSSSELEENLSPMKNEALPLPPHHHHSTTTPLRGSSGSSSPHHHQHQQNSSATNQHPPHHRPYPAAPSTPPSNTTATPPHGADAAQVAAAYTLDSNLYVASLPEWFTDGHLRALFERFGCILSAKVMCHKGSSVCKGYGFVLFQRTEDAVAARSEMIGHVVGGNKIQVRRARSNATAPLGESSPPSLPDTHLPLRPSPSLTPLNHSTAAAAHLSGHAAAAAALPPVRAAAAAAPSPMQAVYAAPTYFVTGGGAAAMQSTSQPMLLAIQNGGATAVQSPGENVFYMVMAPPPSQPSMHPGVAGIL